MNTVAIIPARMAATRFPGKPLAPICGIPMVGHVFARTRLCKLVSETWIATCDAEIRDYARSIGAKAVMTGSHHERAADRTAEAMLAIEKETGKKIDIAAMVQGDEPMVFPEQIDQAVQLLLDDPSAPLSCLMSVIDTDADFNDPNLVKVVVDRAGYAVYFSREPIPSRKKGGQAPRYRQVPIIPFRRDYLLRYTQLEPGELEKAESVDLLRPLEHGDKIKMGITGKRILSVDTPQDLERVVTAMSADALLPSYAAALAK